MPIYQQCEKVEFSIASEGYYTFNITASCLRGGSAIVKIDDISFREIPAFKNTQRYNVPASWNGNKLLGKKQTNIFIIYLKEGKHHFEFTHNLTKYDEQIMGVIFERFDFDTEIAHDEGTNWFYYGVDSSWKAFRPDWRDASKWQIKRIS